MPPRAAMASNRIARRTKREGDDHVQQVTVSMGEFSPYVGKFESWFDTREDDLVCDTTWWESVLRHFPGIKRLDLSRVVAATRLAVLIAAAKRCLMMKERCLMMKELVLRTHPIHDRPESIEAFTKALRSWHMVNGGLRFLTIPFVPNGTVAYSTLLAEIAASCPGIKYLECYTPIPPSSFNQATFAPAVAIDVWTTFCRCCSNLRAFDWQFAPLTTHHLAAFAATPRPQLEGLTFELSRIPASWHDVTDLSSIMAVVAQAPALRFFELLVNGRPTVNSMSAKAYDELVYHLVRHCPSIVAFTCVDYELGADNLAISGDAIVALARLGSLRYLTAGCISLRDDTLVELLKGMMQTLHLEQAPADLFANTTLEIYINGSVDDGDAVPDPFPSTQRLESRMEVKKLVESIKQKYAPWLSYIRVEIGNYCKAGEATIETITGLDLLINVSESRVQDEYVDEDENGRRSKRGGVFCVPAWSTRKNERYAEWERTKR